MPENLNKVARVTLLFWLMKILATTLGETLGDQLSMSMGLGYATGIGITLVAFLAVLFLQVFRRNFYAPLYWAVIVGTTTLGTEISDFMDRSLGLGYLAGSAVLLSAMLSILAVWHKRLGGIRVYPVTLRSEELFYWAAILASNSLGTAFGDLLADDLGFTYLQGAMITAGVIGVVLVLHRFTKLNHVLLFWIAFIFTRPFGATFGDLLTKSTTAGGLDLGTLPATLVTAALLGMLIIVAHRQEIKEQAKASG
ncbi:MAG: hypothetical protein IPN44_00565 [Flavobacteriales bacterium]|nr:hypothetical protein [Flavobacteriales bacterium]